MTTVDDILRRAQQSTGLHDLDSDSWREGLGVILKLIDDPRMSENGVASVEKRCVDALANRLRVSAYVAEHPQVREQKVEKPLFILGMPRTGTTVVSYLLDRDPARRSLLKWRRSTPRRRPRRPRGAPTRVAWRCSNRKR
jgi:Sulfotransferase family